MTYIVKEVRVFNQGAIADNAYLRILEGSGEVGLNIWNTPLAALAENQYTGWTAFGPGDQLQAFCTQGNTNVWASGAALPGTI